MTNTTPVSLDISPIEFLELMYKIQVLMANSIYMVGTMLKKTIQ